MTPRQTAIDIEAVNTTDPPDFDDPTQWLPFAIALSHRPHPSESPETDVLIARDGTPEAERRLLVAMANWIHDHTTGTMLHFNGGEPLIDAQGFDLPILAYRIQQRFGDGRLREHVKSALDHQQRDLFAEICDSQPPEAAWPSLEAALRHRDINTSATTLDGELVDGSAMPDIGRSVFAGDVSDAEREALRRYAASDVAPLHRLADRLDRERQSAAEASAITQHGESATGGHDA